MNAECNPIVACRRTTFDEIGNVLRKQRSMPRTSCDIDRRLTLTSCKK